MRRRILATSLAFATAASLAAIVPAADATSTATTAAPIEASLTGAGDLRAFVRYDRPVTDTDVAQLAALGVTKLHRYDLVPFVAVITPRAVLDQIAALDGVAEIQEDHGIKLDLYKSRQAVKVDKVREQIGATGKGKRVAVIDSGVDSTHPDLQGRVESFNFEGGWIFETWQDGHATDTAAEMTAPYAQVDEVGHGTHVAGTIAGTGAGAMLPTGSKRDLSGMAPAAEIVSFKIASAAQGVVYDLGWEANALAAIEYLVEHNSGPDGLGIRVVNNSWSIYEVDDPDTEPTILMIRAAIKKGLLFVFAAGNNGAPAPDVNGTVSWPGAMGNVITVAATEKTSPYRVASFSSRGYQVDISAPGADIIAPRSKVSVIDFGLSVPEAGQDSALYMGISGTSMATPHVAGIAALLLEVNPKLTAPKIEEILERTAVDLGASGKDHKYGYGMVNAYRAALVARCLATGAGESCFSANGALPASSWASDWTDKGDRSDTAQGSIIPL